MANPDLVPATQAVADLALGVTDDQLDLPSPCPDYTVGGLLGHLHGVAQAFAATAAKDLGPLTSTAPKPGTQDLPTDWRESMPDHLNALGQAWQSADAWSGMTAAGGVDLPGEVAGLVALNELVVHGWDIARATGQGFNPGAEAVGAVHGFLGEFRKNPVPVELFGPVVDVSADAPTMDQAIALSGRDPFWTP